MDFTWRIVLSSLQLPVHAGGTLPSGPDCREKKTDAVINCPKEMAIRKDNIISTA